MEVEVADVGAVVAGAAEADLSGHVGAGHVDLAPVVVDDLADALLMATYYLDTYSNHTAWDHA